MVEVRLKYTRKNIGQLMRASRRGRGKKLEKHSGGFVLKTNGHVIKRKGDPPYAITDFKPKGRRFTPRIKHMTPEDQELYVKTGELRYSKLKAKSSMSDAAKKAWETRRKKYGKTGVS